MEEPLEKVATNASFSEVGEQAVGGGAQLPDGRVIPSDDRRLICLGMSSGRVEILFGGLTKVVLKKKSTQKTIRLGAKTLLPRHLRLRLLSTTVVS